MPSNKHKKIVLFPFLSIFLLTAFFGVSRAQVAFQSPRQINISARIVNQENEEIPNGEYSIRFSIYTVNRETVDPYPSDSDSAQRVWSETQNVQLQNGFIDAFAGAVTPLPESLDFTSGNYYLGIRINSDSEMVPRKRIGAMPLAINSFQLQGAGIGDQEGDIPVLGTGGLLDVKMIPSVTDLGTITNGVWEADPIESDFITENLTGKTYNDLTLTANSDGFSIAGGDVSRMLTVLGGNVTLSTPGNPGTVMYSDGTSYSFTAPGSAGQVLLSGGSGTPTWGTVTGGSGGIITADSLDFTELADTMTLDNDLTIDMDGYDFLINGTLQASSIIISGQATIGTLGLNLYTNTSFIPSTTGLNLGSSLNHWANLYVDNLSAGGMDINGTSAEYFTINTDSEVDESMGLRFYRSALNGYAALVWDAGTSQFNLFARENTATMGNLNLGSLYATGNVGIGDATPDNLLEILSSGAANTQLTISNTNAGDYDSQIGFEMADGTNLFTMGVDDSDGDKFKISTTGLGTSDLFVIDSSGNAGIGTSTPGAALEVVGDIISTGTEWTARSAVGINDRWKGVDYGNGLFVAVGNGPGINRVMTSSDGINWTARSAAGNDDGWSSVTYGNGIFVAVGVSGDRVMTSPDGINWTARSAAGNDDWWYSVTYGNGLFVAVGGSGDRVMTSPDGINWTARSAAGDNDGWSSVTYGNGLFVAVGGSGDRVMTSPDGINWTVRIPAENNSWGSVAYGNGLFVAVGGFGNNLVMTSPDGINWTARSAAGNNDQWLSIAYGNGLFVAGDNMGDRIMTSPDGINWTVRSAAGNNDQWLSIVYGNGMFVAVGSGETGDPVLTSGKLEQNVLVHNNTYQGGMNIFGQSDNMTANDPALYLQRFGTAKTDNTIFELTNSGNAADMDGTLSSILFNQWYYDASTPAVADSGKITFGAETDWTSTASTQDSYLSFSTALDGTVAEKMRITSGGNVGIGDTAPDNLLEIMSSGAANTQFTISNTNAGDYNPQIGFELADGTNLFTMGVDDSDGDKFKIYSGLDITGTSEFTIDSNGLVSIANLEMGAQVFADDSGAISWIDMGVTGGVADNTPESYTAQLDGNNVLTIYGLADGAGGVDNIGVGIGTTGPSGLLDLEKAGTAKANTDFLEITNSTNAADMDGTLSSILFNQWYYDASTPAVADSGKMTFGTETDWTSTASTQDSYLSFSTALDGTVAEKMRITSGGNVGIGTANPGYALEVIGTGRFSSDINSSGNIYGVGIVASGAGSTTTPAFYWNSDSNTGLYNPASDNIGIVTGGSERLRIDSSGNVGIGITPTALLHLGGTAGVVSFEINSNETTAGNNVLAIRSDVAGADDLIFRVQANGAVFADGAYTGTGADYAEYFETADTDLESGEAVCIDPLKENSVKRCVRSADNNVMGIVSSNPSIVGNSADGRENDSRYKIVAMLGQIQGKVSSENGTIQVGDSLTSSTIPGYLRKANPEESTVGIALQNFAQDQGSIQILISRRNKSLTVEKVEEAVSQRIAEMNVEDQVNSLISSARTELDVAMATLSQGVDAQIQILSANLEAQLAELQSETQTNLSLILQNSTDINTLTQKVASILGDDPNSLASRVKKLETLNQFSSRNLENGGMEIIIVDPEAPTIGEGIILAGESLKMINTKAATNESRIYITPVGPTNNQVIYVGTIAEGSGFEVKVDRIKTTGADGMETAAFPEEIKFNWWIVASKEL